MEVINIVGVKTKWNKIQIAVTVDPEHIEIIEKILNKQYSKPVAHQSASEVIRKAVECYADFLGVRLTAKN